MGKNWEVGEWQDNEVCEYVHVGHMVLCRGREGQGKDRKGGKREGRGREEGGRRKEGGRVMREKGKGEKEGKEFALTIHLCMLHMTAILSNNY